MIITKYNYFLRIYEIITYKSQDKYD